MLVIETVNGKKKKTKEKRAQADNERTNYSNDNVSTNNNKKTDGYSACLWRERQL